MIAFTRLFLELEQTTSINARIDALVRFFEQASDADRLWTIALFTGRRPKRTIKTSLLRQWAAEIAGIPTWLFEETYHIVGDLAETIALLLPPEKRAPDQPLSYWIEQIRELSTADEAHKKSVITHSWSVLSKEERFIFNKLLTGGWRIGVSSKLLVRALARFSGQEENVVYHRLMGTWTPDATTLDELLYQEDPAADLSRPYPFFLAYPLDVAPADLGAEKDWVAERKWDGIRGQIIIRGNSLFIWSRGEELVTDKYPEFDSLPALFPSGAVFDGEILPYKNGAPLPFQDLQTRIGRKNLTKSTLSKTPVAFFAYDLLEEAGTDLRNLPFQERRAKLDALASKLPAKQSVFQVSPLLDFSDWNALEQERQQARAFQCEGLMLKKKAGLYQVGRKKGDWWKWKIDPLLIDAVLIYAQRGHGRRANLFTDYTFAVWQGEELVPFTKAYSGLTDQEFRQITQFVTKNTLDRFGPVRRVKPDLVFEIAFEGINASSRHKSGVALRFPRMNRWRQDKPASEANTLEDLLGILAQMKP